MRNIPFQFVRVRLNVYPYSHQVLFCAASTCADFLKTLESTPNCSCRLNVGHHRLGRGGYRHWAAITDTAAAAIATRWQLRTRPRTKPRPRRLETLGLSDNSYHTAVTDATAAATDTGWRRRWRRHSAA